MEEIKAAERLLERTIVDFTYDTKLFACSLESCWIEGYEQFVLTATYQLEEDSYTRDGSIILQKLATDDQDMLRIEEETVVNFQAGILDTKWSHQVIQDKPVVGLASSVGQLYVYALDQENGGNFMLDELVVGGKEGEDCLFLALDWNNFKGGFGLPKISASQSNGKVSIWSLSESSLVCEDQWNAHQLGGCPIEVWTVGFNKNDPEVVLSGADDMKLKGWDMRIGGSLPIVQSNVHEAGVTSLAFHPTQHNSLVTGSYDQKIRFWDWRKMDRPLLSCDVGGGVWRLKWHPHQKDLLAVACMHGGCKILECEFVPDQNGRHLENQGGSCDEDLPFQNATCEILANFQEHKSMAYGIDWINIHKGPSLEVDSGLSLPINHFVDHFHQVASCSFYDHVTYFWKVTPK